MGEEFGTKYTYGHWSEYVKVDGAAAAQDSYSIGHVWCANGTITSHDDQWLINGT